MKIKTTMHSFLNKETIRNKKIHSGVEACWIGRTESEVKFRRGIYFVGGMKGIKLKASRNKKVKISLINSRGQYSSAPPWGKIENRKNKNKIITITKTHNLTTKQKEKIGTEDRIFLYFWSQYFISLKTQNKFSEIKVA